MSLDLEKYPEAACAKHGFEKGHTFDPTTGRCADCQVLLVKRSHPDRWERNPDD